MSVEPRHSGEVVPSRVMRQIDALCDEFEDTLKFGGGVSIGHYLARVEASGRTRLLRELAVIALRKLHDEGAVEPATELLKANPTLHDELELLLQDFGAASTTRMSSQDDRADERPTGLVIRCPHCSHMIDMVVDAPLVDIGCPSCGGSFSLVNDAASTWDAAPIAKLAHFELLERLGMGEFGTVWKARDTMLDRTVAIKIPRRGQLDAIAIEKFMREARAAAQLHHPNIVSTHEVGRQADTLYIVGEYVRGSSLGDTIADHRLEINESVVIVTKVADALEHAHGKGIVHRDLKPSNIIIDDFGEPHLMDFGLAKRKETGITVTTDGAIVGTPAYMSPEQARGEASSVDGRSDVYSLGVILFQLLTDELPFRGSLRMLLQKVINDDPSGPRTLDSRIPKDLDTICLKCLEKEPGRRYATAGDLAADLRRSMAGEPIAARRIGVVGRSWRWAKRNRAVSLLLAATATTLVAATTISSYFAWRATNNLYDSLLQEMRLTHEVRGAGYAETVRSLVDRARRLPTTRVDDDELRRQLVLTYGDFAAYSPRFISPTAGKVSSICLSDDGRVLFVGYDGGSIIEYDMETGQPRGRIASRDGSVIALSVADGGSRLVSADNTGRVEVWGRGDQNWTLDRSIEMGPNPDEVFFSRHGERAAFLKKAELDVWDVSEGTKLRSLPTKPDWLMRNGAFDIPNGKLVSAFINEQADTSGWAAWDLASGERLHESSMKGLGDTYAHGSALTATGNRLAIGFDLALVVYEMSDFKSTNLAGFDSTMAVAFSPTNPYLAAANIRGGITVWNSATKRQLASLQLPTSTPSPISLSFSADGGRLVAANANSIQIWDLAKANEVTVMMGHDGAIPCAAFRPDGKLLATGGKDNEVRYWDPFTGQVKGSQNVGEAVQTLAFSPDGRMLAVGCMGKIGVPHLRLIDSSSEKIIYEGDPAMGEVFSLNWSESAGELYLAGGGLHGVAVWKVIPGEPVKLEPLVGIDRNRCLATVFNRSTGLLVWAENNHIKAWDIDANRELPLHAPDMNQGWNGLALLPDGQSIIYVSDTGVAQIWDAKRDHRSGEVGTPKTFVAPQIAVSPNGNWLAALTALDTVSVWHRPTGKHVFSLRPTTSAIWSLAWNSSSDQLEVGQSDGGLAVWDFSRIREKLAECGLSWDEGHSSR